MAVIKTQFTLRLSLDSHAKLKKLRLRKTDP